MRNATYHHNRPTLPRPGRCYKCGKSAPFTLSVSNGVFKMCSEHWNAYFDRQGK